MTVLAVFGVVAAVLVWRAIDLQFSDREFLQEHGDARYLRVVQTEAHRGMITDRNGEPLAISTPVASVWAKPSELLQQRKRWPELARILDLSVEHAGRNSRASSTCPSSIWTRC
jgi:cell division protein FtsI (penicillin-binding protein 3)